MPGLPYPSSHASKTVAARAPQFLRLSRASFAGTTHPGHPDHSTVQSQPAASGVGRIATSHPSEKPLMSTSTFCCCCSAKTATQSIGEVAAARERFRGCKSSVGHGALRLQAVAFGSTSASATRLCSAGPGVKQGLTSGEGVDSCT